MAFLSSLAESLSMQNQKILYSHGKKILIQISEKIAHASIFADLSFGLPTSHTRINFQAVESGHFNFGQSNLVIKLDNKIF